MIRFAVDTGQVVPAVRRKWAIGDAVRRNVFARGFKRDIGIAPDLTAQTEQMIELAALDALAIAGNAGDQRVFQGKKRRLAGTISWDAFTLPMPLMRTSACWRAPCAAIGPRN